MHYETTNHDKLQAVLDLAGLDMRASEIHGMVCGEICRRTWLKRETAGQEFVNEDLPRLVGVSDPENGAAREVLDAMEDLMKQSQQALDAGLEFSLLLPDDDEAVEERTESLADWARGFALVFLRGGDGVDLAELDGDSAEVVRDFLKISEAQSGNGCEEDERALMEIEEYMRVGVQLIFEKMQPQARSDQPAPSVH